MTSNRSRASLSKCPSQKYVPQHPAVRPCVHVVFETDVCTSSVMFSHQSLCFPVREAGGISFQLPLPHPASISPTCLKLLSLLPGKWSTPITGRGGSPATRTGSSVRTQASSTWSLGWTCGSVWVNKSRRIHNAVRRLLSMHNKVFRKKNMFMTKHRCGLRGWRMAWCPALPQGRPSVETSRRITFIVLAEVG